MLNILSNNYFQENKVISLQLTFFINPHRSLLMAKTKTPQQVKDDFRAKGVKLKDWAKENNYPVAEVYKVLNGERKGHYGRAHKIAVALGLKSA